MMLDTSKLSYGTRVRVLPPQSRQSPPDQWTGFEGVVTALSSHDVEVNERVWVHVRRIVRVGGLRRVSICKRYGERSYTLHLDGEVVGTASRSSFEPDVWICDFEAGGRIVSMPLHRGSLLSALRYVRSASRL